MSNIKIKVNFYDDEQKKLIAQNYPNDFCLLKKIIDEKKTKTVIEIPSEDFQTYALFRDMLSREKYIDLNKEFARNWGRYERYFKLDGDKIINIYPERIEATDASEMLGVAGALSVASQIYGFTHADWEKIPISGHKDFDFKRASFDDRFIVIEAKGSIVDDNTKKQSSIPNHKRSIIGKKNDKEFIKIRKTNKSSCIGIITAADRVNNLQSWLVDPIIDNFDLSPKKSKLLQRLRFYLSIMNLISERTHFSVALANRIRVIESIDDYQILNGIPIVKNNFEPIKISEQIIYSHSGNVKENVLGKYFISENYIYFIGIDILFLRNVINQNYEEIISMRDEPITTEFPLRCKIRNQEDLMTLKEYSWNNDDQGFRIRSEIIRNSAGLYLTRQKLFDK